MSSARPTFGFESRAGQFSYPFLISFMLLVHRYVYPAYPELRSAEFYLSIALAGALCGLPQNHRHRNAHPLVPAAAAAGKDH